MVTRDPSFELVEADENNLISYRSPKTASVENKNRRVQLFPPQSETLEKEVVG